MNLAVLASGEGTTLQAVVDGCAAGAIAGTVTLVIGNNSRSGAMTRARRAGIPTVHLSSRTHPEAGALDHAMCAQLRAARVDWVLLAGYMKRIGPATLDRFRHHIVNTHPALLPEFAGEGCFGRRVHEAVLAAGKRETGVTMHLVEGDYDTGPIVSQVRVPVRAEDTPATLEERVKSAERKLVVNTLAELLRPRASNY